MGNDSLQRAGASPRIKARLVPLPREFRHVARCDRCGQILWTVIDGDSLGPSWLNDLKRGWRFDPDGRIWRPTTTHLRQRREAGARVSAGTATSLDRAFLRVGGFGRKRSRTAAAAGSNSHARSTHFAGSHVAGTPPHASRFGVTADLPVAIQCARCGAENDVEDPIARAD